MVVVVFGATACRGSESATTPTQPTATPPTQPTPTAISQVAKAYLDAALEILQAYSFNKDTIDWTSFRTEVFAAAGVAQTISDTYPAFNVAIRLLNDHETYYSPRNAAPIGPSPVGGCGGLAATAPRLPDTVGYVKVASCVCQGTAVTQFAESIQRAIKAADRADLAGWIVDLRGNGGGNMWPMIAGVGPVLGEGIVGWIVYNNREYEREYRDGAATSFGEAFARVSTPYRPLHEYPKVAVLTDGGVVSAGEGIVVFFKGRPATRSFGTPTCGHHHLLEEFRLSDGAVLVLNTARHADRTKRRYAGPIQPAEIVADPAQAAERAVAWLQDGK